MGLKGRARCTGAAVSSPGHKGTLADLGALDFTGTPPHAARLLGWLGGHQGACLGHGALPPTRPASLVPASPAPDACQARPAAARVDD